MQGTRTDYGTHVIYMVPVCSTLHEIPRFAEIRSNMTPSVLKDRRKKAISGQISESFFGSLGFKNAINVISTCVFLTFFFQTDLHVHIPNQIWFRRLLLGGSPRLSLKSCVLYYLLHLCLIKLRVLACNRVP